MPIHIYAGSNTLLFIPMLVLQTSTRLTLPSCQTLYLPEAVRRLHWKTAFMGPDTCSRGLYYPQNDRR